MKTQMVLNNLDDVNVLTLQHVRFYKGTVIVDLPYIANGVAGMTRLIIPEDDALLLAATIVQRVALKR